MASKSFNPWDPFGIARSMRSEVERLVEGALIRPAGWLANWEPGQGILPLDVYTEGDNLIVKAAMPGLKSEEVKVEVEGDALTIVGESKQEQENKGRSHHLRDHFSIRLERSVLLPAMVDANKADAVFADGVLTVTLPRAKQAQASQIANEPAEKAQTVEPETVATETVAARTTEPETAEAEPVAAQASEPAAVEMVAPQMVEPEPVAVQAPELTASETLVAQGAEPEPIATETVAAQAVEPEPVAVQPVAAQAADVQKVERRKAKRQKHEAAKVEVEKVA